MTIKDAIVRVLNDNKGAYTYLEVLNMINDKNYIDWSNAKTPSDTIGARLGSFIRNNDSRVKRINGKKGFMYYLSKYENELNIKDLITKQVISQKGISKTYQERDLHILLSSFLKNQDTFSKTIFHEKSLNRKDDHQKWLHPDMIGIDFLNLENKSSNQLMKTINRSEAFNLTSYELKKEIKSDYELKKCFFQAVSNSSWANYGYLVAFDISKTQNLINEMERLSQSFGIGIIELAANPYESKVLFSPDYKELDFKTIDKICLINKDFEKFIKHTEAILSAPEKFIKGTRKEFEDFCDGFFETESDINKYCKEKYIPFEEDKNM